MKALLHLFTTSSITIALATIFALSPIVTVACPGAAARQVMKRSLSALQKGGVHNRALFVNGKSWGVKSHFPLPEDKILLDALQNGNFLDFERHVCVEAMKSQPVWTKHRGKIGLAAGTLMALFLVDPQGDVIRALNEIERRF